MILQEKIIDYSLHSKEIDHWINLKGEKKYLQIATVLEKHQIPVTWKKISDAYRYDKRLLINCFKYLSFYEEFLRAKIWNNGNIGYEELEKLSLAKIMERIIQSDDQKIRQEVDIKILNNSKYLINHLRNCVSHNKIILNTIKDGKNIRAILMAFKDCLPIDYRIGFSKDINRCLEHLHLDNKIIIRII